MLGAIIKLKAASRNVKARSSSSREASPVSKEYSLQQIFRASAAVAIGQGELVSIVDFCIRGCCLSVSFTGNARLAPSL